MLFISETPTLLFTQCGINMEAAVAGASARINQHRQTSKVIWTNTLSCSFLLIVNKCNTRDFIRQCVRHKCYSYKLNYFLSISTSQQPTWAHSAYSICGGAAQGSLKLSLLIFHCSNWLNKLVSVLLRKKKVIDWLWPKYSLSSPCIWLRCLYTKCKDTPLINSVSWSGWLDKVRNCSQATSKWEPSS